MTKHSPLPWKKYDKNSIFCMNESGHNRMGIRIERGCFCGCNNKNIEQEIEANTEFIVRACNSHYELVEACKYALEELTTLKEHIPMNRDRRYIIEQALKKAEEKTV